MESLAERLTNDDLDHGRQLLHDLHRHPELSGGEVRTASRVRSELLDAGADEVLEELGTPQRGEGEDATWHGVLARFGPVAKGGILLRCELDALPIEERTEIDYRSGVPGCAHLCGHDGHMSILLTVARVLGRRRDSEMPVWLLFQPAEETGAGARAVRADPRWRAVDAVRRRYAVHNLPGFPLGAVVMKAGTMCCASTGVEIELSGRAAHAAQPETGRSPARALSALIDRLEQRADPPGCDFATVVGAELGERAFGTAPDSARLFATLRSPSDEALSARLEALRRDMKTVAERDGLRPSLRCHDEFRATVNDSEAVARVRDAVAAVADGPEWVEPAEPFRWSEDFGELLQGRSGALIGLGAGMQAAPLHDPEYVFPEQLIARGASLLLSLVDRCAAETD